MSRHQKRAKYCLELQGKQQQSCCCVCGKKYARNDGLKRHEQQCEIYVAYTQVAKHKSLPIKSLVEPASETESKQEDILLKVIDKYGEMVKDLQKQIAELSSRPANQTNTNRNVVMNNLQPITDEDLQDALEHLTLNFIQEGAKGYADFAGNYPFKEGMLQNNLNHSLNGLINSLQTVK